MGSGRILGLAWHLHRSGSSLSFCSVLISVFLTFPPFHILSCQRSLRLSLLLTLLFLPTLSTFFFPSLASLLSIHLSIPLSVLLLSCRSFLLGSSKFKYLALATKPVLVTASSP
ncbi:hypothetical protein BDW59DRAFT_38654 [Aspergillus cavernicola]|uniref:Uncharacterized protein n=1 Tax=Aspergillus cavernicola TaxID=176166 RepID=A0ABR4INC7_9EURO